MLYLSGATKGDLLGVKDTSDNIEEFYTKEFLLNSGLDIVGLTSKLNRNFSDEYFIYEYTEDTLRVRYIGKGDHAKPVLRSTIAGEKITNLHETFSRCTFTSIDMSLMDLSNATVVSYLFSNCYGLKHINFGGVNTSNVKDFSGMFCRCKELKELDLSVIDMSNAIFIDSMFYTCSGLQYVKFGNEIKRNIRNASSLFSSCDELKEVDLSSFCFDNTTTIDRMFRACLDLKKITWGNSNWSKLKNCRFAFYSCCSLLSLNLSIFKGVDTSIFNGEVFYSCDNMLLDCRCDSFQMCGYSLQDLRDFNGRAIVLSEIDSCKLENIVNAETAIQNTRVDYLFLTGITTDKIKTLKVPRGTSLEAIYLQLELTKARKGVYILKEV